MGQVTEVQKKITTDVSIWWEGFETLTYGTFDVDDLFCKKDTPLKNPRDSYTKQDKTIKDRNTSDWWLFNNPIVYPFPS